MSSAKTATKSEAHDTLELRPAMLVPALVECFRHRDAVLIKGAPGVGKTDMVNEASELAGCETLTFHPVVSDPTDFKGMPAIKPDGTADFIAFGDLKALLNARKPTVAFFDDVGQAAPSVQAALMQLLLARKINGHKVSDHVTFCAATNRKQDKAGVSGMLEPVKSRFVTILGVTIALDDWIVWAFKNGIPSELIGFINFRKDLLLKFEPTADITNSPCPRTVAHVGRILKYDFKGLNQAVNRDAVRLAMIEGAAGLGFATELQAFLTTYAKLPDPKLVLKDPKAYAKLFQQLKDGDEIHLAYALAIAVSAEVNYKLMPNFCDIIKMLPSKDFGVMAMRMLTQRDSSLEAHPSYNKWGQENFKFVM